MPTYPVYPQIPSSTVKVTAVAEVSKTKMKKTTLKQEEGPSLSYSTIQTIDYISDNHSKEKGWPSPIKQPTTSSQKKHFLADNKYFLILC